jgi:hypothetical protein
MHSFVTLRDQSGHCSSRRELMFLRLGQFRMGQSQQALAGRCRWGPSRYAWPGKWFCSGDKLIRWTGCTHAGQEMPMLPAWARSSRPSRPRRLRWRHPPGCTRPSRHGGAGVGDPGVQRQPDVLLAEVDLDGAWQGQMARGQDAAELPQPGGLARGAGPPGPAWRMRPRRTPEPGQAQRRARSQARREYGNQHTFSCEQWF